METISVKDGLRCVLERGSGRKSQSKDFLKKEARGVRASLKSDRYGGKNGFLNPAGGARQRGVGVYTDLGLPGEGWRRMSEVGCIKIEMDG